MSEYSVDELREMAKRGDGFRPGHTRGDIAASYADLLERIKADEGVVPAAYRVMTHGSKKWILHPAPLNIGNFIASGFKVEPLYPHPPVQAAQSCQHEWAEGYGVPPYCNHCGVTRDTQPAQSVDVLPFDDDVQAILGRMCFQCIHLAAALRAMGHAIDKRAEAEQAAVLHWMLNHYLKHGKGWSDAASAEIEAARTAALQEKGNG